MIEDPARIASELRNLSAGPENLARAWPAFGPAKLTSLFCKALFDTAEISKFWLAQDYSRLSYVK